MDTLETDDTFTPSDLDDALDGKSAEQDAPEAKATPDQLENTPIDPPKTETESAKSEPSGSISEPEKPPAPDDSKPNDWTYAAYSDEKSKRQAAEERARALEARLQALEWQQKQGAQTQPAEAPDYFENSKAYTKYVQQQAIAPVIPQLNQLRRQLATTVHGADKVQAAEAWFDSLPPAQQQAMQAHLYATDDPYGGLVQEHGKHVIAQEISDPATLEAFRQWKASQSGQTQPQPAQGQPAPAPATPKVSITPSVMSAPSVAARNGPKWAGPTPIENLLPE